MQAESTAVTDVPASGLSLVATGTVVSAELVATGSQELIRQLPPDQLYLLEQAGEIAREVLDEQVIGWTEEGRSQRWIAEQLGCSHVAVGKRQARLGVESLSPRGGDRIGNPVTKESTSGTRYPEVVQFGIPAEIQETMAAALDAMPEPEREESLAKIRGEHGSWERKDAMAALAGLPPMPRPDQAPPPGSESAIDDLVSAWDAIGAAIREALVQDRAARGDYALTDSQLFRLDTARERVQEEIRP
jgi:hypothetical protein